MKHPATSSDPELHKGITIHSMPIGDDFPGIIFTVGCVLIFLFALAEARWFAAASIVAGLVFFGAIRLVRRLRKQRN